MCGQDKAVWLSLFYLNNVNLHNIKSATNTASRIHACASISHYIHGLINTGETYRSHCNNVSYVSRSFHLAQSHALIALQRIGGVM